MSRRERTFPMRLVKIEPTPSNPSGVQLFYAHEWEAYQKSLQPDQPSDEPAQPTDAIAETTTELADAVPGNPSESDISSASPASSASSVSSASFASRSFSHPPDFSRHSRSCAVCSHPDRDCIEADFIRWRSPGTIARDYKIANRSSIYRHAHSTGLFAWRKRELGRTLESILESCEDIPLESADIIIRAARIYAHLDERGNWFEPPRTNFIFHAPTPALGTLESDFPTNSARVRKRSPKQIREGEEKVNRNIHQSRNSVNSLNPEEKANS
jgi:hypothetical protein